MYINKKTSLYNLFKKYKMNATDDFDDELRKVIAGVKRIASKALTIDLYRKINIWLIEDGSPSAVFARAFLCVT